MTYAAGTVTVNSVTAQTANLTATAATGGTGPYTYQWYRSTTANFTPGAGNLITGATALTLADTGLVPNTIYHYKIRATDTGNANATADSADTVVTTAQNVPSMNALVQSTIAGQVDLRFSSNVLSVVIDATQTTPVYPGQAMKIVGTNAGGVLKVVACTSSTDDVAGFLNYDVKANAFNAGDAAEMSIAGNCMYLYATTAINSGAKVELDPTLATAAVAAAVGSSGNSIVGWAYDQATAPGAMLRVMLGSGGVLGSVKA